MILVRLAVEDHKSTVDAPSLEVVVLSYPCLISTRRQQAELVGARLNASTGPEISTPPECSGL
jgi:hypothetical protein